MERGLCPCLFCCPVLKLAWYSESRAEQGSVAQHEGSQRSQGHQAPVTQSLPSLPAAQSPTGATCGLCHSHILSQNPRLAQKPTVMLLLQGHRTSRVKPRQKLPCLQPMDASSRKSVISSTF